MNSCNFEEVSKKVDEEYQENCRKINTLDDKIRVLDRNTFGRRFLSRLTCSMPFWLVLSFLVPNLIKASLLPVWGAECFVVAVPLFFGTVLEKVYFWISDRSKDLRSFSNAKTEEEIREEKIRYEIEKEKLKGANQILQKNREDLKVIENSTNSLSTMYHVTLEDEKNRTKEEISKNIENSEVLFQKKQQKVEVMITKRKLRDQFGYVRRKSNKAIEVGIHIAVGMLIPPLFGLIPLRPIPLATNITNIFGIFTPAILGGVVSAGYISKRLRDDKQIFQRINQELGEDKLSDTLEDFFEEYKFHWECEDSITDAARIRLGLEMEKQRLKQVETSSIREPFKEEGTMQFTDSLSNDVSLEKAPTLKKVKPYKQ